MRIGAERQTVLFRSAPEIVQDHAAASRKTRPESSAAAMLAGTVAAATRRAADAPLPARCSRSRSELWTSTHPVPRIGGGDDPRFGTVGAVVQDPAKVHVFSS